MKVVYTFFAIKSLRINSKSSAIDTSQDNVENLSFPGSAWECVLRGSASVFGTVQAGGSYGDRLSQVEGRAFRMHSHAEHGNEEALAILSRFVFVVNSSNPGSLSVSLLRESVNYFLLL